MDKGCSPQCLKTLSGVCVAYTGKSIPCIGIKQGENYDSVVTQLAERLCKIIEDNRIDLQCLFTDHTVDLQTIPDAIRIIIDILCNLKDIDIRATSDLSCISENTSKAAASITHHAMTFSISAHSNTGKVNKPSTGSITTSGDGRVGIPRSRQDYPDSSQGNNGPQSPGSLTELGTDQ